MAEIESAMGRPPVVLTAPDGDTLWQFPRGAGQRTYIARSRLIAARISGSRAWAAVRSSS